MQTAISWYEYMVMVLIITGGYYIFIGFKFYRKDIKEFLSGKWKAKKAIGIELEEQDSPAPYGQAMEGTFDELEEVVHDLKTAILESAGNTDKEDLLDIFKQRLVNYAGLRKPAFRVAVNHYIIRQVEETCGVAFSEEELNAAWKTLPR